MKLAQILKNSQIQKVHGRLDIDVTGLHYDSRQIRPGDAFFALRGVVSDGHNFIPGAIASGAVAVVSEELSDPVDPVTTVLVKNSRRTLALAAAEFYGNPTRDMHVVGVTGTNGKTTVTYLLEAIMERAGLSPAVVGTVNYRYGAELRQAPHTTPEALDLMKQVSEFKNSGARSLVMEVSSHALDQYRADGVHFRVGVFTNLTPEHLDYHLDMERYFSSKYHLFKELLPRDHGRAVINVDDAYGLRLAAMLHAPLTCGRKQGCDIHPESLDVSLHGIHGRVGTPLGPVDVSSALLGDYNVENLLCAIGAAVALDLPLKTISEGLADAKGVPGRLEQIENERGAVILVDYAHTGDALRRVIDAMQALAPKRLLTVFGCGGDRDRSKRPIMAEVAASGSDIAIATSDNPRTEDPERILNDVRSGLAKVHAREWNQSEAAAGEGRGYVVIPERRQAIEFAVSLLRPGDLLLVAGKGHEDYQILGTTRIHFDDREELRRALQSGGQL
ncbi:MAG: UDP-N-acetylmuramoyl-L-alanyl-D-glutamate--2,6-diaminopimelate ligase [Desulfuromonadales bacterium]